MNLKVYDDNDDLIRDFFSSIDQIQDFIDEAGLKTEDRLSGEKFFTDSELASLLRISRRTLQEYRTNGKIPYYQVGTKILYKESEIKKLLESGYRRPFDYDDLE